MTDTTTPSLGEVELAAHRDAPTLVPDGLSPSDVLVVSFDPAFLARCSRVLRARGRRVDTVESVPQSAAWIAPKLLLLDTSDPEDVMRWLLLLAVAGGRGALVLVLRSVGDLATAVNLGVACVDVAADDDVLSQVLEHAYSSPRRCRGR